MYESIFLNIDNLYFMNENRIKVLFALALNLKTKSNYILRYKRLLTFYL